MKVKTGRLLGKLVLVVLVVILGIAIHEQVHVLLFSAYGCRSTIEWWPLPPKTIPDNAQLAMLTVAQLDQLRFLQMLNEVITYPILFAVLIYVLLKK